MLFELRVFHLGFRALGRRNIGLRLFERKVSDHCELLLPQLHRNVSLSRARDSVLYQWLVLKIMHKKGQCAKLTTLCIWWRRRDLNT